MQDQLTAGSTNLQQQQGNLQQNTPNLQQSGTPTSTADTSSVLSEAAPAGQLQVTTVSNSNTTVQPDAVLQHGSSHGWLLLLLIIPVLVAMYIGSLLWSRAVSVEEVPLVEEPVDAPTAPPQPPKKTKSKKKSNKRKKSGRR
jgi:hypothetical protein